MNFPKNRFFDIFFVRGNNEKEVKAAVDKADKTKIQEKKEEVTWKHDAPHFVF